jgi:hypothetical protein
MSGLLGQVHEAMVVRQKIGLGLVEHLDRLLEDVAGFILELFGRGAQDLLKDANQLRSQLLDSLVGLLICVYN